MKHCKAGGLLRGLQLASWHKGVSSIVEGVRFLPEGPEVMKAPT